MNRARTALVAVAAVTLVAGVAACTSSTGGTPQPSEQTTTTTQTTTASKTTSTDPEAIAPKVANPLDASAFLPQPCAVLTVDQLKSLDVSKPGKPTTTGAVAEMAGPYCGWRNSREPIIGYDIGFLTGNKNGLSDTYRGRKRFEYFEPTTLDGYPAVFNDGNDHRDQGSCNITVGISDTLALRAGVMASTTVGRESCEHAKKLASAAIATLKAGP